MAHQKLRLDSLANSDEASQGPEELDTGIESNWVGKAKGKRHSSLS